MPQGAVCCWCGETLVSGGPAVYLCPTPTCQARQLNWRIQQKDGKGNLKDLYVPTPRQVEFHECPMKHTLFGGSAGPGKSHSLRWDLYTRCLRQPGYEALLLRRTFPELEKTHIRKASREAPMLGAVLVTSEHVIRFSNGSLLEFGHCDNDGAISKYLSTEYDCIAFDELVTFERDVALEIMTRARTSKPGLRAMVKCGSNPGGVGALWVLDFFIDKRVDAERYPFYKPEDWGFVPANLEDNPYRDAEYEQALTILDPARYQQLRFGNWRVFDGQMFGIWDERKHVVDMTIQYPAAQTWFCSMDWGFNAPGVCLWWIAASDGHYLVVDELKFKETAVRDVARAIKEKSKALGLKKVPQVWADPAIWQRHGQVGEAIAETFLRLGVPVTRSNNDRMNGWQRLQEMLRDAPDGRPWLQVERACRYLIRTLPAAVRDKTNPEDLDTAGDDHCLDACLSGESLVTTLDGPQPLATLGLLDIVLTREGWKPLEAVALTQRDVPLRRLEFSNGASLTGTDSHPVWIEGRGFVPMDTVKIGERGLGWPGTTTATRVRDGARHTGRFRQGITSIIATGISRITRSTIWNACQARTISACTDWRSRTIRSIWQPFVRSPWRGIGLMPVACGTATMPNRFGRPEFLFKNSVLNVPMNTSTSHVGAPPAFVPTRANRRGGVPLASMTSSVSVQSATHISGAIATTPPGPAPYTAPHVVASFRVGTGTVYNITVSECHEYFANGILVKNCRYGAMSRRRFTGRAAQPHYEPGSMGALVAELRPTGRRVLGTASVQGVSA